MTGYGMRSTEKRNIARPTCRSSTHGLLDIIRTNLIHRKHSQDHFYLYKILILLGNKMQMSINISFISKLVFHRPMISNQVNLSSFYRGTWKDFRVLIMINLMTFLVK